MHKKIFLIISLIISILTISTQDIKAQNNAPTYQSMMELGDQEFNKQEYIKAKAYYQEALRIKGNDPTAKSKLDKTLQKIREQSEKEEVFFQHLDEGDSFYNNSDYEKALAAYNEALKIFPEDEYTLAQVATINKIINDEKEKLASFNEILAIADNLMSQKKYAEASLQYKAALELYPNHTLTQSKYEEAQNKKAEHDRLTANFEQLKREAQEFTLRKKYAEAIEKYQSALEIFPDDTEVKGLIAELTEKKRITELYDAKIAYADSLYMEKSYEPAIAAYNDALTVIPNDAYATDMISRINETFKSEEYLAMQNYLRVIEEAKSLETNNELEAALLKYQEALTLKADDEFATQKIEHITELLNKIQQENELNAQYAELISAGDASFVNNEYQAALESYTQANALIPDKAEALEKIELTRNKINEIEAQLALEKQRREEELALERQRIENEYTDAIISAEVNMNEEKFVEAIADYEKALRLKPNDAAATLGLREAEKRNEARLIAISNEYKRLVSSGDIEYTAKNYDKAIEYFTQAMEMETGETYPSEMLTRISEMLKENRLEVLVDSKTKITSNNSKRFTFKPINVTSRRGNYIVINAKNLSPNGYNVFISYGSDEGRSGSLMIRVPDNMESNNYIIRIGAQYKWFSEDNTWIEVTPENGDIEIESMEITKGD